MHTNAKKLFHRLAAKLAGDPVKDPLAKLVVDATEEGMVVPSILRKSLEAIDGLKIVETKLKVLHQVQVFQGDVLLMSGASVSMPSALLHAALGYLKQVNAAEGEEASVEELDAQIAELKAVREKRAAAVAAK